MKVETENISRESMLEFIREFISSMHDYEPTKINNVVGCFNCSYHGGIGKSVVIPMINSERTVTVPILIIVYILKKDGRILVCDSFLNLYNLEQCIGPSVQFVYESLIEANKEKTEYEFENKKPH